MTPLHARWPGIRQQLARARHVLLCCDLDGTLAPMAPHPARVRMSATMRASLRELAAHRNLSLALISGRRLADLKRLVAIRGVYYAGNHGVELQGRGIRAVDPIARQLRPALRRVTAALRAPLRRVRGAWLEDKGLSLSVHVRQAAAQDRPTVERLVRAAVGSLQPAGRLRIRPGKMVWEVRPAAGANKGAVIQRLAEYLRKTYGKPLIIVLGDDQTDEDAFRAANRRGGLSIRIGPATRRTSARYRLVAQSRVGPWLKQVSEALRRGA